MRLAGFVLTAAALLACGGESGEPPHDVCEPSPCDNGGTCTASSPGFVCECPHGFEGETCGENVDDCTPNPCANDGACVDGVDAFTCVCVAGWAGDTCADNIDDCTPNQCENGGTCIDGVDAFTCGCAAGWSGPTCSENIDDCAPNPCENGGTCADGVDAFECECALGFDGALCSNNIDDCTPSSCENGGLCIDGINEVACACPVGFAGERCELSGVLQVVGGSAHTCALLVDGAVKCWGEAHGYLFGLIGPYVGNEPGDMGDALPAIDLGTGRTATSLTSGTQHICAILDDDSVKCWGHNYYGELGLGDTRDRDEFAGDMGDGLPTVDLGTGRTAKVLAAGGLHTCAILDDDSVKCWGDNTHGQLGYSDANGRGDEPGEMGDALPAVDFGSGRTAKSVWPGLEHTCAILDDDSLKCWGHNPAGQLGYGDKVTRGDGPGEMGNALPTVALGASRVAIMVAAGSRHTCALLDDHTIKCWGGNANGQLGAGDTLVRGDGAGEMGDVLPTVDLGPGATATALSAGISFTCALLEGDSVKCWGLNNLGQLGCGDDDTRGDEPGEMGAMLAPLDFGSGRSVVGLATFGNHACVRLDDEGVKCWGRNTFGQLGLGDVQHRGDDPGELGDALPAVQLVGL